MERIPYTFVIPSGAMNLSFFSRRKIEERFLAPLGMTKINIFPRLVKVALLNRALNAGILKLVMLI
jgi:hypothetical protein